MADLDQVFGGDFDPTSVPEDERNFDVLPAGDYQLQVIDSEVIALRSGNGDMLKLTLEVLDGPFANRKVWDNLNIRHTNAQAQSIAQRALADLCLAVGVQGLRNSEDLHFKPFVGTLKVEPPKDGYDAQNRVKKYKPRGGVAPTSRPAPTQAARPAAQPAQAGGTRAPWPRKSA